MLLESDVGDFTRAAELVDQVVRDRGGIDLAVASLGGWWRGPDLCDLDLGAWSRVMRDNLQAHFVCARHVLAAMRKRRQGTYVFIGGPGGISYVAHSAPIAVAGSGQLALAQSFGRELRPHGVRVLQLFVAKVRTRERGRGPQPGWITPEDIGHHIVDIHDDKVERPAAMGRSFLPPGVPPVDAPELKTGG